MERISVIGLGKLGLCIAGCFADKGYKVWGADIDISKIEKINQGLSPIDETGLAALIKKAKKNLMAVKDCEQAVSQSDVSFVVVATPSLADGSFSNEYLEKALQQVAAALKKKKSYHLVVITSTVMPQTTEKVAKFILEKSSGKKCGKDFGLAYNPEFIALGSVIHDFLNPDFILIGEANEKDGDILEGIYKKTCENSPRFARMSPLNAEIAKISLNCYVTTKITFANSVAAICEKIKGADAGVVTGALGLDSRIGIKYIRPGLGYGGPCFPRDNVAFAALARILESRAKLAEMVDEVNRDQVLRVLERVKQILSFSGKDIKKSRIAVLGLSYKPNTPIIEDAQALEIARILVNEASGVTVFDPQAMENSLSILGGRVRYAKNAKDALKGVDLAVIAVPWEDFKKIDPEACKETVFLDCWKILKISKKKNVHYLGVGV